ncbi:hypothetical protein [Capnocytophaga sputigena]|jgi:hypothetical protein|uniref:hypothetical protein n=1 Tax=Capnocytophaga sputigena TaxID=1019 RepID=UPI00248DEC93|nr:hypothetical protein [Capnocytophaga sputigena]
MSKINQKTLTESATTAAGVVAGAMVSRVAADKISGVIKKPLLRHGALALAGLALAAFVTPKETSGKLLQSAGAGMAATQLTEVLKSVLTKENEPMKDGILKTALGTPAEETTVYVDSSSNYDYYPYEEVDNPFEEQQPQQNLFLSGADLFAEA